MKQKDIVLIVVIVFVTGVFSYIISNIFFAPNKSRQQEVEVVQKITADFTEPDKNYFSESSINLTKTITIGDNTNPQPFKNE